MSQEKDFVDIDLNFEYTGASLADGIDEVMRNVLEYQMYFETMDWTKEELDYIAQQLVETGKIFAINQGFSPTGSGALNSTPWGNSHARTGALYNSIRANVNGNQIQFYNDAKNYRGQPYAGHMEYGFHDRSGKFIPARPFMRPAMYAVAEGSKGDFRGIMKGLLENLWTHQGFNGISSMLFGRKAGSQSLFWKQNGSFGSKLSQRTRMNELRGNTHRKQLSANRKLFQTTKTGRGHKGYRFSKVRKDFSGLKHGDKKAAISHNSRRNSRQASKADSSKQQTRYNITRRGPVQISKETIYTYNGFSYKDAGSAIKVAGMDKINEIQQSTITQVQTGRQSYTGRFNFIRRK